MNQNNPLVSIVIPTYNRADLIRETLQSIQKQTYWNWECIIVDDGSTDNTIEYILDIIKIDKRIKIYKRDNKRKGAPSCRNIGIHKSIGDYIIFLDSDDLMANFCIERRVRIFQEHPENDFIVFQSLLFQQRKRDLNLLWNIDSEEDDLNRFLRIDALWPICGPIYKRNAIIYLKGFNEDLGFWQDYDLHLKCLLLKFKYIKFLHLEPDCFIRWHFNESISRSIPFTKDIFYLQKRIDFFYNQIIFIKSNKVILNHSQNYNLISVIYYFSSLFIIDHSLKKEFKKNWNKTRQLLEIKNIPFLISLIYPFIIYFRKKSIYFIKIANIYKSIFRDILPDLNITSKTSMLKNSIK